MKIVLILLLLSFATSLNFTRETLNYAKRSIASTSIDCDARYLKLFSGKNGRIRSSVDLIKSTDTIIVAHGKNTNIAPESTWANMVYSVKNGGNHLGALEIDLRMTKDGHFIVSHDPTFHRLVKNYKTPNFIIEEFRKKYPELAAKHEHGFDFLLFDNIGSYSLKDIKGKKKIYHPQTSRETEFITLEEIINSISKPEKFIVNGPENPPVYLHLKFPLMYYLDLKNINHYGRRIDQLPNWNWQKNNMTIDELKEYTVNVIENIASLIKEKNAYDNVFLAARHTEILKIFNEIDPQIKLMFSPASIVKESSAEDYINYMTPILSTNYKLAEVKFLHHILNPDIRNWANNNGVKLFYNKIVETDPSQFEGKYLNNLELLVDDILSLGKNVILQTNTVSDLAGIID